jgi:Mn2+/Fe2+ NRAMP family transporter
MLAIPVMAGSTSYALAEARGKREGLDLKPRQGRYFYGVIAASLVIGLCLNFIGVNPIKALVFAAAFNGVIAVPLIWFIDRIAADQRIMGAARSGRLSRVFVMLTFLGMAAAVVATVISYIKG